MARDRRGEGDIAERINQQIRVKCSESRKSFFVWVAAVRAAAELMDESDAEPVSGRREGVDHMALRAGLPCGM